MVRRGELAVKGTLLRFQRNGKKSVFVVNKILKDMNTRNGLIEVTDTIASLYEPVQLCLFRSLFVVLFSDF